MERYEAIAARVLSNEDGPERGFNDDVEGFLRLIIVGLGLIGISAMIALIHALSTTHQVPF